MKELRWLREEPKSQGFFFHFFIFSSLFLSFFFIFHFFSCALFYSSSKDKDYVQR